MEKIEIIVGRLINDFEEFYLKENIDALKNGKPREINPLSFLQRSEYEETRKILENHAKINSISLEKLIFEQLTESQRNRIGGLLKAHSESLDRESSERKTELFDEYFKDSPECNGFLQIQQFLSEKDKDRFARKIAALLYDNLSQERKRLFNIDSIRRYILNIGYIHIQRPSYKGAINFVKKYPSLFANEKMVLYHIGDNYIDEELTNTNIENTHKRILSLQEEIRKLSEETTHAT